MAAVYLVCAIKMLVIGCVSQ